jgi:hypothetical protein
LTIVAAHEERDPLAQQPLHAKSMAALARIEGREVCFEFFDECVGVGVSGRSSVMAMGMGESRESGCRTIAQVCNLSVHHHEPGEYVVPRTVRFDESERWDRVLHCHAVRPAARRGEISLRQINHLAAGRDSVKGPDTRA